MIRLLNYINKTLSLRLSVMVVSAMAFLLMVSLTVMLHYSRKAVKEEALQKATQTLEGTVQRIDNILLSVEQASGNIYFDILKDIDNPDKLHAYSFRLVESCPFVSGCAIAFVPEYSPTHEPFMAYYHHEEDASDSPIVHSETFSTIPYTEQRWFTESLASGMAGWITYSDADSALFATEAPITTFCLPIFDRERHQVGVIGIDVSLSLLSHIMAESKPSANSYCALLAQDGSYIVHPDTTKLNHQAFSIMKERDANPTVKKAAEAMMSGQTGYSFFYMDGIDYYVFYKPYERSAVPGRSMAPLIWSVGIIYPEDDIFGDYNRLIYWVFGIAIVGLLLLFVLCRALLHHQLKNLILLTNSARRIAKGNYDEPIPENYHHDEIGRLQKHFKQMQQSLSAHVNELEQVTATLQERGEGLRHAYEKAQQADRLKTAFLHNMTDQMSGPAATILSDVNALCDSNRKTDKEEADRIADDIQKQGKTITELLNNLLRVSEEETGKEVSHAV